MTTELKDALERYRRWEDNPGLSFSVLSELRPTEAAIVLADAYHLEHPADEDEPAGREWLLTLPDASDHDWGVWVRSCSLQYFEGKAGSWWMLSDRTIWRDIAVTRGHVRRLLAGLGIPLKEQP